MTLNVLHALQGAGFTSAIIAGGFWRDIIHGIKPRDVDVFIVDPVLSTEDTKHHLTNDSDNDLLHISTKTLSNILGIDENDVTTSAINPDNDNPQAEYHLGIRQVLTVTINDLEFQIITTDGHTTDHIHEKFDIGLCRIYHDGDQLHMTDDFLRDAMNSTLTVFGDNMSDLQYSYTRSTHLPRFRAKYPNHRVVLNQAARKLERKYQETTPNVLPM